MFRCTRIVHALTGSLAAEITRLRLEAAERDAKVADLETYIDELLVKVIDLSPKLLQTRARSFR